MADRIVLPPYEPQAVCPACGHDNVSSVLHPSPLLALYATGYPCRGFVQDNPPRLGPHQCRKCQNCNYAWMEQPLNPAA